jgi:hypothetical protein
LSAGCQDTVWRAHAETFRFYPQVLQQSCVAVSQFTRFGRVLSTLTRSWFSLKIRIADTLPSTRLRYNHRMRRFARYALNTISAMSLLLCAGTAALWARGTFVGDFVWHNDGRGATGIFNARGSVMITWRRFTTFNPITPGVGPPPWEISHERPPRDLLTIMDTLYGPTRFARRAGFAWGVSRDARVISRDVVVPLWAVTR